MSDISLVIEKLTKLGCFTDYEIMVYIKLLEKKFYTASQMAAAAGVPRTKTYEVINSLVNKGFCKRIPCPVKKFSAVEPEIALENIKARLAQETSQKCNIIDSVLSDLKSVFEHQSNDEPENDYVNIYKGKTTIWQKIQEMTVTAKSEILVFSKEPYIITAGKSQNAYSKVNPKVKIKTVYQMPKKPDNKYLDGLEMFHKAGEEIKMNPHLPSKLTIIDREFAIIVTVNQDYERDEFSCMIVNQKDIVNTYISLFDYVWADSESFQNYIERVRKPN